GAAHPPDTSTLASPTPNPEQEQAASPMDPLQIDESGAQGAQGLTSAWSDPDWALLTQALVNGSSTGLRRSLDEPHCRDAGTDEVFGGVD
ncbi:MAG: hypothetical protein KDA21_15145, partial [Phycisphaerales bacterium]|nr:hypothetical protein [Phycisphaerales bacterium]